MEFGQEAVIYKASREVTRGLCWLYFQEVETLRKEREPGSEFKSTAKEYSMSA